MADKSKNGVANLNEAIRQSLILVLAGGRGSRLKNLTDTEAKPAVPFAGKFRIIDFALSNCVNSGMRRVGVLTQYRAHNLIQHVQRGWGSFRAEFDEFVEVWPAQQQTAAESWYSGTADAVYQNIDLIESHHPKYVVILGGDHIYKQDYSVMLDHHITSGAQVTVACLEVPVAEAREFGVMDVDEQDQIVKFLEKPQTPPELPNRPGWALASMGIYIFDHELLVEQLERDALLEDSSHDFGKDLIPYLVPKVKVMAHRFSHSCVGLDGKKEPYWRDVGTLDAYWEANMDLTHVTPELDLYDPKWPIWTYQVQRPAAKFVFNDDSRRGYAVDSLVSAGCVVSGSAVERSLLFTDVRVNSYSFVSDSVILSHADIGRKCTLIKCIVGPNTVIPDGMVIGKDPQLDAQRFYRTEGGVTLVTQEHIDKLK
ncbi:glucose-1-phosphate adenylyltransferase [Magnetococcus marinus MC-1]|uniref:Glucose-1-phosphate adenylyltransferase n=1 Tax=Magnetococcus marinus (strain ATCC BAA-1437 / JCM 17883 / MC-1) TaxID=156889 RepID=A0L7T8_MAGMM|nr:glucose-1-phosphate adenylyltransferase [Magnetococcus marinus]ABK44031.1 glucose-1-phosphate adenylyltransferase [Magnetococcus marinus MC-1]